MMFHDGAWHAVKPSAVRTDVTPAEGQRGIYQGRKLVFHRGERYYDTGESKAKPAQAMVANP